MRFFAALLSIVLLTGCQTGSDATATPTIPQLTGTVMIEFPVTGALIYSELIQIAGTAVDLPTNTFILTLMGPDEIELAQTTVSVDDGSWQVELSVEYQDEPVEVAITAESPNRDINSPYDIVLIAVSGLDYRPEGTFGSITFPTDDSTIGGDSIQVEGLASGLQDNRLVIQLIDSEDKLISEQTITTQNPYFIDEMPWSAEVALNGYAGPASLNIADINGRTLASTTIEITGAAG